MNDEIKIKVYKNIFGNYKFLPKISGENFDKAIDLTFGEIIKIIDKELLDFGCVKEDFKRKDLDSFPQPIVSILRLRQKIIGNSKIYKTDKCKNCGHNKDAHNEFYGLECNVITQTGKCPCSKFESMGKEK